MFGKALVDCAGPSELYGQCVVRQLGNQGSVQQCACQPEFIAFMECCKSSLRASRGRK
ncbi:MAG: hypothetical protein Q8P67_06465 [archaeon]|nr:hypothetical protein [archaeon]